MSSMLMYELISKCKYICVFSMFGYSNISELLDTIGSLKHICYIDLSHTSIKKLHDSICFPYNLQVLKLRKCQFLEELPMDLHELINLHYLDFSGTRERKTPMLGKFKNLQSMSSFYLG